MTALLRGDAKLNTKNNGLTFLDYCSLPTIVPECLMLDLGTVCWRCGCGPHKRDHPSSNPYMFPASIRLAQMSHPDTCAQKPSGGGCVSRGSS